MQYSISPFLILFTKLNQNLGIVQALLKVNFSTFNFWQNFLPRSTLLLLICGSMTDFRVKCVHVTVMLHTSVCLTSLYVGLLLMYTGLRDSCHCSWQSYPGPVYIGISPCGPCQPLGQHLWGACSRPEQGRNCSVLGCSQERAHVDMFPVQFNLLNLFTLYRYLAQISIVL